MGKPHTIMHTEESTQVEQSGVLCVHVSEMVRPSLTFEEVKQEDGSLVPGDTYWSAVEFTVESPPLEVYGCHRVVDLCCDRCELWRFYDATIMLSPNKQMLKSFGSNQYVMTYQRAERRQLSL